MWTLVRGQWVSVNVGLGTPPAATPGAFVAAHELAVKAEPAVRQGLDAVSITDRCERGWPG